MKQKYWIFFIIVITLFSFSPEKVLANRLDCTLSPSVSGGEVDVLWSAIYRGDDLNGINIALDWGDGRSDSLGHLNDGDAETGQLGHNYEPGTYRIKMQGWTPGCSISVKIEDTTSSCSINSFTADNTTPDFNTGTTLRFSLSGSFAWSISLEDGTESPSPASGEDSGSTSDTGNLKSSHTYRLSCGDESSIVTVIPKDAGECIPDGRCSASTPSCGETTTGVNSCGNACSKTGGSCSCIPDGSCSAPSPSCGITSTGVNNCGGTCTKTGGSCGISGACGTRNTAYPAGTTSYPVGSTYCAAGTPDSSPAFPKKNAPVFWSCVGRSGGDSCSASVLTNYHPINIPKIPFGGKINSVSPDTVINCKGTCSGSYEEDTMVVLKATPLSTYWQFNGWGGDCLSFDKNPTCTLTITSPKSVSASFIPRKFKYEEF